MDYSSDGMADPVYHAMLVTGYDDDLGFEGTKLMGTDWGDDGYGWIGYEQFKRSVVEVYWTKDVILKELSGVSVTHAVDPRLAIENVWQSLITLGRFSHPPKLAEIDSVIPNSILPKDKEDKTKFLQALGGNIIECKRVALLPKVRDWGSPDHQTFGMVERFTFSPKFFPSKSTVPEDIAVYVNIGREGEVKGWGFQGRIAGLVVAEHQADSPGLEIGEPGVEQPVTRGGLTGIAITLPGRLNDAANHREGWLHISRFPMASRFSRMHLRGGIVTGKDLLQQI